MLGVIICDDDRFMMETSARLARQCIKDNTFDATVVCVAADFNEVLRYVGKNPGAYLYFLDIDFGKANLNGVDITKIIKKTEPLSKIVFVTSHADLGMGVLKSGAEAFGFIVKTANAGKMLIEYKKYISLALGSAAHSDPASPAELTTHTAFSAGNAGRERYISLSVGADEYVSLPVSQILYVEADKTISHFIRYHTVDGSSVSTRGAIESALADLGAGFMKSHRSVIINKNQVVSASGGVVKFAGGETAACSFRLRSEIIRKCGVKKAR